MHIRISAMEGRNWGKPLFGMALKANNFCGKIKIFQISLRSGKKCYFV
jgi:hypothetical protein